MSTGVLTTVTLSLAPHFVQAPWRLFNIHTLEGQHGGRLAWTPHESVRDNIVFPFPGAQVVS